MKIENKILQQIGYLMPALDVTITELEKDIKDNHEPEYMPGKRLMLERAKGQKMAYKSILGLIQKEQENEERNKYFS